MYLEFIDNQNELAVWPVGEMAELICDDALDAPREFCIREGSEPGALLFDYGMGNARGAVLARGIVPAGADAFECEDILRRVIESVSK